MQVPATLTIEQPEMPKPDEGNVFSTISLTRTTTSDVVIEHPAEWSEDEVRRAAMIRMYDVGNRASFWDADTRTTLAGIEVGEAETEKMHGPPVKLSDDDLTEQE